MTKTLASILFAVAVVLLNNTPATGNPRDIWIGVLGFREPYGSYGPSGLTGVDLSVVLEPFAALVSGRWWFESNTYDVNDLVQAIDKVPAQWLPRGTALPSTWHAHLFDGRRVTFRTSGPLQPRGDHPNASQLIVRTDLKSPQAKKDDTDGAAQGLAVVGDVRVQLFADLAVSSQTELLRFFAAAMLAAERAEIQRQATGARGLENAFPNDVDTELLTSQVASTPRRTNLAKTASQQGGRVYLIEGAKTFKTRDVVATLFTGAGARRDRNGVLHLLGTWSYLDANEWAHENRPISVVERNGRSCWLIAHAQEGGQTYSLTKPG